MPLKRIEPPPTKFGPAAIQPKIAAVAGRASHAPPPTRYGPAAAQPKTAPPPCASFLPPPSAFAPAASVIQPASLRRRNVGGDPPEEKSSGVEKSAPSKAVEGETVRLPAGTILYHGTNDDSWATSSVPRGRDDGLAYFTLVKGSTPKQVEKTVLEYPTKKAMSVFVVTGVNKASYPRLIRENGVDALRDTRSSNGEENFVIPNEAVAEFVDVQSGGMCSIM